MKKEITIFVANVKYKKLVPELAKAIRKLLRTTKNTGRRVSVNLIDDPTMRKLNRVYRGKNKTTDVLAFPAPTPIWGSPMSGRKKTINIWDIGLRGSRKSLGEIYLAPDYIKKQQEDIVYLLVHGFLHLLGFDHKGKNDSMKIQRKEKELLIKLMTNNK